MKVKIKGLVFVGFAAAILSANAMAAGENTVTSKAYVDNKFQTIANITQEVGATGQTNDNKYPSETAVRAALSTATNIDNFIEDSVTDGTTNKAPTENAVYDFVGKGTLSLNVNGTTATFGANQANNSSLTVTGLEVVADKLDGSTNNGIADTDETNDTTKYPSAKAVKDYVTAELAAQNALDDDEYQAYSQTANQISDGAGSWKSLNSAIDDTSAAVSGFDTANGASTGAIRTYVQGKIVDSVANESTTEAPSQNAVHDALALKEDLANKLDGSNGNGIADTTTGANGNEGTMYPSAKAVKDYVQGITNGNTIPAQDPLVCTAAHPCALVAEPNATSGAMELHWYTMAQNGYDGGVLGDAQ